MPDGVTPADPGLLSSVADELALPGYYLRNLMLGRPQAAAKNLGDFVLNIPDAALPGDLIPEMSGSEDRPDFSDVLKETIGPVEGVEGSLINLVGNTATDPLTYIPGSWVGKAGGAITKGLKAVAPQAVKDVAGKVGKVIRKTAGAEKIGKPLQNIITRAQGAKETAARASQEPIVEGLKGATTRELEAAGEVLTNVTKDKATQAMRAIDETDTMSVQERLARYLADNPDVRPDKLAQIVSTAQEVGRGQWASGQAGNIFTDVGRQPTSDVVMGALPGTTAREGVKEYFPRMFKNEGVEDLAERLGQPNAIKGRKLDTTKDVLEYLAAHPETSLTTNVAEVLGQRAAAQGELAARGATGQGLLEMARAGEIALPDELLAKALPLYRATIPRAVVTEGGGDVGQILGGATSARSSGLLGIGEQSGTTVVPQLEEVAERALDPYGVGLGSFSGRAKPPTIVVEEVAPMDIYGIGSQSGKAKPPVTEAIEDAGQASRALYGVGGFSGKSKPPATGVIDERIADPYGVGAQSGLSKPPATGAIDERSAADALVGTQSGKAVVGRSVRGEEVASGLRDLGVGSQTGKSVVGQSTAKEIGLTELERKQAREWLLSQQYKQADPLLRETAEAIAKNLPGDEADVALHMLKGMEGRKGFPKMLASLNSRFKPVAVFGALAPKLGSITRNMTGSIWQKYSNPEARSTISPRNIPAFLRDWWASMEDGIERLFGKRIFTKNEFAQVDEAYKIAGGDPRKALAAIQDPVMRGAVERGVLGNNFVDTEGLIAQTQRSGPLKFAERAWDYPAAMFKGAEGRMRYGLYKSLVAAGKSEDDAARIVRESLYDYSQSSMENRAARDVIPFFQFLAKSVPQQAKLMAEKPWLASTISNAYAPGRDEPVSPMMEGKLNIPLGLDEMGNRQYLSNLGLPFESLSMLPNLSASPLQAGRDIEQNVVGSLTPLLKTGLAYTFGRDPTFGSIPGSYQKVAGQDLGEFGGFVNQLAGTGIAPLTAAQQIASMAGRATDDRTTISEKILNNLTGARIQSVDPDQAIQQRLQSFLERDPSIGQYRTFFSRGEEDVTAESLLENLKQAQKSLKQKRKEQASVN